MEKDNIEGYILKRINENNEIKKRTIKAKEKDQCITAKSILTTTILKTYGMPISSNNLYNNPLKNISSAKPPSSNMDML